ncbi:patatin-like phospholipase family protein (plasmid) [Mycetohabitans endofungorum]
MTLSLRARLRALVMRVMIGQKDMSRRGRPGRQALAVALAAALVLHASASCAGTLACAAHDRAHGRAAVGLVLSGGGARGYAHLGVLKVLEENRIPVDCIAGTSMGAVVGGLYASGMSAIDMQSRLADVNLTDIAFDVHQRAELPQSQREDEQSYASNLTLGVSSDGLKLPRGLVQGNRLQALLSDWTSTVPGDLSFDKLPIPYRAIATELRSGQMIVLDHGSLPQAIRASMAMPGLFAPTDVDGRTLVDGGLVSNLPVDTVRAMGADVVIAVDVGSPLRPLDALATPADVMQQMIGILIRQNVAQQRSRLVAGDVLIQPDLGSLTFTDFANAAQAIEAGEAAARAALPQLRHLALAPADYAVYRRTHAAPPPRPIRLTQIDIESVGAVPAARIRNYLHVRPGDLYDPHQLNKDLLTLSNSGDFEDVTQKLVEHGDEHRLVITARQKSWGPNFLLFGLGLSSSSTDEGGFRLHLGYRRPWLSPSGLEGRVDTTLGSDLISVHGELRQPLSSAFGYYVAPYVEYVSRYANLYSDNVRITRFHLQTKRAGIDFGLPLARLGDLRIGLAYAHGFASPLYNLPLGESGTQLAFPDAYGRQLSMRARLVIDQLDDSQFPRSGYFTEIRAERSLASSEDRVTELYGKAMAAASFGRHSINVGIEGGKDIGGTNAINPLGFTLGGFRHLSAYAADQLAGTSMAYAHLTYMNQLTSFNAGPFRGLFAGVTTEIGNVWNGFNDALGSGPMKRSVSLFTGLTSSFGPVYFGVALAPEGRRNVYFQFGHVY